MLLESGNTSVGSILFGDTDSNFRGQIEYKHSDESMNFYANGLSSIGMRIDSAGLLKFNSGYGSVATAYGCRAWVNFNGTGTVAIRGSGNVSSITDNGTGIYSINFAVVMPDENYTAVTGGGIDSYDSAHSNSRQGPATANGTTSLCRISCGYDNGAMTDWLYVACAVFR